MSKARVSVQIPKSNSKKRTAGDESSSEADFTADSEEVSTDDEIELEDDEVYSDNGSSDSGVEGDSDADENLPKLKKRKKATDDGSESFSTAVNAILGSKLKAYDRKDPILARSKQVIKKAESDKLEAKARRELLAEKKKIYDKDRIRDLLPTQDENARSILEHEKRLKKVAQKGVVRLFNVVMATQNRTSKEVSNTKILGQQQKEKLITEVSKEKFFDLVKAAGDS